MIRRLVIILLCLGVAGTALSTVVSFWRVMEFKLYGMEGGEEEFAQISARSGLLSVAVREIDSRGLIRRTGAPWKSPRFTFVGFEYWDLRFMTRWQIGPGGKRVGTIYRDRRVNCPAWIALVALAAYPIIALIRGPLRLRHRRKRGHCLECGYNLTGNTSGVCPECARCVDSDRSCGDVVEGETVASSGSDGRAG